MVLSQMHYIYINPAVCSDSLNKIIWNTQDGAAVTGLVIAGASLVAVNTTGNAIYDPIGSIIVGNLLGMVCDAFCLCNLVD